MLIAVISDIHANGSALEAVLADVIDSGAEQLWCLGDLVGYGAEPNRCIDLVREYATLSLCGNHDLAVRKDIPMDSFSDDAATAVKWTAQQLRSDCLEYLHSLQARDSVLNFDLYHASPRDPVWEYVISPLQADLCMDLQEQPISLVGHSHIALAFHREIGSPATGSTKPIDSELLLGSGQWLLNPGSVGQPRDGDPRAAWLLLDTDRQLARWRRSEYDIRSAAKAIRNAGLPITLAERLSYGK